MEIDIKEIIETVEEYLPRLITASESIAYKIQSGNEVEAVELLYQFIDGLNWVTTVFSHLEAIGINVKIDSDMLNNFLKEIEGALSSKDFILIADLFEYEIIPILSEWLVKIKNFLNKGEI